MIDYWKNYFYYQKTGNYMVTEPPDDFIYDEKDMALFYLTHDYQLLKCVNKGEYWVLSNTQIKDGPFKMWLNYELYDECTFIRGKRRGIGCVDGEKKMFDGFKVSDFLESL